MADSASTAGQSGATGGQSTLAIPSEIAQKYAGLIALIQGSESMNDEERQYWVNILPIMTPDQVKNLSDILENERKQLAAIDAKYQTEVQRIGQTEVTRQTEEERKKRRSARASTEKNTKEKEEAKAEELLQQIDGL